MLERTSQLEKVNAELRTQIESRQRVEQALREGEERLRKLLETTRVIPWEADAENWQFTYVGPQAVGLLGYPVKEWYQQDFWGIHIHPDDREAALEFCHRSFLSCQEYEFEYRMIASDDSVVWIHDLVTVDRVGGRPKMLRGFMMDITERKKNEEALRESESRMRLLADTSSAFVSYVDHQQRFQYNNAAYEKVIGLSRQQMKGRFMGEILGEKAYAVIRGYVEKALSGQKVTWEEDMLFPDGITRRLTGSYRPHCSGNGQCLGFYGVVHDISQRIEAEKESRRHQQERSERTEKAEIQDRIDSLTPREQQVLVLVVTGLLNKQIGAELGASEKTIKVHRARVMEKMQADSLPDLVRIAEKVGIHGSGQ